MSYVIGGILLVVGVILFFVGLNKRKLRGEMADVETSNIGHLREGQVEVKGVAGSEHPLQAPGIGTPCVYYQYEVERKVYKTDSNGNRRSEWKTVDQGKSNAPFTVADETGIVTVDPNKAKVDCPVVADQYLERNQLEGDGMFAKFVNVAMLSGRDERIKVRAINLDTPLYVLGHARPAGDAMRISKGDGKFFISTKSEEELLGSLGWQSAALQAVGILAALGGAAMLMSALMKKGG